MRRTTHSTTRKTTPTPASHNTPPVTHSAPTNPAALQKFGHSLSDISVYPETGEASGATTEARPSENLTGLPNGLKSGIERLFGLPLAYPKSGPPLPGYNELFAIYGKMRLAPEPEQKRMLMDPVLAQHMDTLEQHIQLAQQNAPVNTAPVVQKDIAVI